MIEALMDKKTWLFMLLAVLANVMNSITNQLQIIILSFGFTPLKTTLLGCINGLIQSIAIYSGVTIVSCIPNSRAWIAIIFYIPSILSVLLVNFLPWHNRVGLLFSVWLSGVYELLQGSGFGF
jgi:ACS family allantoate permease-like MFS transporter